jgi:S1-C subfamily serine protease
MHKLTEQLHKELLYPSVRVRAQEAGGSGTIIFSEKDEKGEYQTFVLTNHHVIDGCIKVKKKWDSKLGKELKKETKSTVYVEIFQYKYLSSCIGSTALESDIVCYDADQDIALLKLRTIEKADYVANFIKHEDIERMKIFDETYAVGASLGHPPIPTLGQLTFMDDEIDNYKYWMSTSQVIYGNSGGAIFSLIDGTYYFIGVPSRGEVSGWTEITHMGYFIPPTTVIKFLNKFHYSFIHDKTKTMKECNTARNKEEKLARKLLEKELGVVDDK